MNSLGSTEPDGAEGLDGAPPPVDPGAWAIRWTGLKRVIHLEDGASRTVLDLPEVAVPRGKLTCILGPSGCGKTTLLGILGLVDHDFEGDLEVHLADRDHKLGDASRFRRKRLSHALRRHIGYVFQEIRLRHDARACENVVDPLMYQGSGTRATRRERARQKLELFRISGRVPEGQSTSDQERRTSEFSGGMQQRVALARALAIGPDIICADEPTSHVDGALADSIYRELKERVEEDRVTVIIVTHDAERAEKYADHIIRIEEKYDDTSEAESARARGEWPYEVRTDRQATGVAEELKAKPLSPSSYPARIGNMASEAIKEFAPLGYYVWSLIATLLIDPPSWLLSKAKGIEWRPRRRVPSHRYGPIFVSVLTIAALAGMGFLFNGVKTAIVGYQTEMLDSLQILRRVRLESPGTTGGAAAAFDGDDFIRYAGERAVTVDIVQPNFDLVGWALTPEDSAYMESSGAWSNAQETLLDRRAMALRKRNKDHQRLAMNVVPADPTDALGTDLGLPSGDSGTYQPAADDERPAIIIDDNELDWLKLGHFASIPRVGRSVDMIVMAVPRTKPATDTEMDAAQRRVSRRAETTCLRFRVGGYFRPESVPSNFVSKVEGARLIHATLRSADFQRILRWRYDPLNSANALPDAWRCKGTPVRSGERVYKQAATTRAPVATGYDVFADSPRNVGALIGVIEEYVQARNLILADLRSEREFIEPVVELMDLAEWIGFLLQLVPLIVASIVLWLVVYSILQRRREELLLFLVMGSPKWQLHVQAWFIAVFITVPGLGFGYLLGNALPRALVTMLEGSGVPAEILTHIAAAEISSEGLVQVTVLAVTLMTIATLSVTRSITAANPAGAFRGTS